MDKNCEMCEEQQHKQRYAKPHEFLVVEGISKNFRGGHTGGYEETPYLCTKCGARFIYSNDKNDDGWMLCIRR